MSGSQANNTISIVDLCNDAGQVVEPTWLARAEPVHRQLRPDLPTDYVCRLTRILSRGARMTIAAQEEHVLGIAVWRIFEDTQNGIRFYVDDLVTDENKRSTGTGHALIASLEDKAHKAGALNLILDPGTHRLRAHKFYFREGFTITSFNFKKPLV